MKQKIIFFSAILCALSLFGQVTVDTVWGPYEITHPFLLELEKSDAMQRLKKIDQSGPVVYVGLTPPFSRYDHSVGVLALLDEKAGADIPELAAGLMHDTSHTAFSHLGDNLFYHAEGDKSYQDIIHLQFLKKMNVDSIIEKYGISIEQMDPDLEGYKALEQHLPDLCADRIQYLIHSGVVAKCITKLQARQIIDDLEFKDGKWFFHTVKLARLFSDLSLYFTEYWYGSAWNVAFYNYFSQALKRLIELNKLSEDGVKYGVDQDILDILYASQDSYIKDRLEACKDIKKSFTVVKYGKGDINTHPKCRAVDPLVKHKKGLKRLSNLDKQYAKKYKDLKKWCEKGYGVIFSIK